MFGLKFFVRGLLALAAISCNAHVAWGQFGRATRVPSPAVVSSIHHSIDRTLAGKPVASWTVDPFMTDEQELAIDQWLQTPCPFDWGESTTLLDVQRDLATRVPTILDLQGLEEIGLSQDVVLVPTQNRHRPTPRPAVVDPFNAASYDPFAADDASDDPFADTAVIVAEPPWWHRTNRVGVAASGRSTVRSTPSLGARLIFLLGQIDLTVSVRGGQLIVTTQERAEEQLSNRVYDVTSLLDPQWADPQTLMQSIETAVVPDTWESLGGPSTISVFQSRQRQWLIVSAPTLVQWKVQSLLDQLNR